jgi:hypothetical protein
MKLYLFYLKTEIKVKINLTFAFHRTARHWEINAVSPRRKCTRAACLAYMRVAKRVKPKCRARESDCEQIREKLRAWLRKAPINHLARQPMQQQQQHRRLRLRARRALCFVW